MWGSLVLQSYGDKAQILLEFCNFIILHALLRSVILNLQNYGKFMVYVVSQFSNYTKFNQQVISSNFTGKVKMNHPVYYAHTLEGKDEEQWQTIKEHSENVAKLVKDFSGSWCTEEYAVNLGLLHDIGKYQSDFQRRLFGEKILVEHSIGGAAKWIDRKWPESGAYCIAGHHSGLPDVGNKTDSADEPTLLGRLKRVSQQNFSAYKNELTLNQITTFPAKDAVCMSGDKIENSKKEYAFWTRMMFSCLTDADYLDTEQFCSGKQERGINADFKTCLNQLNKHIAHFQTDTPVKRARNAMRGQVMSHVRESADIYLMNMPTGSGKTLTSMQFALGRAILTQKTHHICNPLYQHH